MKKTFILLIFILALSTIKAQQWETASTMPAGYDAVQLKVVNDNNMIISSQIYKLRRWDGNQWSNIGDFYNSFSSPRFVYFADDDIYATKNDYLNGDTTTNYNYIAHWDGTSWSNANNLNVAKTINNIHVVSANEMYAVGEFELPDYRWKPVAKYFNGTWSVLGEGDPQAGAYSTYSNLWVEGPNEVYSTNGYSDVSDIRIKKWDGNTWEILYNFQLDEAERLSRTQVSDAGIIYSFGYEIDSNDSCLTKWNGQYWEVLGDMSAELNLDNTTSNSFMSYKIADNGYIYVVGNKLQDEVTNNYMVAQWDGNNWSEVGQINAPEDVSALDFYNDYIYVTYNNLVKRFPLNTSLNTETSSNLNKLKVYPNPASEYLKIDHLNSGSAEVLIYTSSGQLIKRTKIDGSNTNEINISKLKPGVYSVVVNSKLYKTTRKIIVK
ncbi:MAG: T9SS type A sorting domain-containing protein [Psychroflexus salarius]